jgi:heat shock protein HslJ
MMACPPPAMDIERRVLAVLEAVTSVTYTADGGAILATPDGRRLTLARPARN